MAIRVEILNLNLALRCILNIVFPFLAFADVFMSVSRVSAIVFFNDRQQGGRNFQQARRICVLLMPRLFCLCILFRLFLLHILLNLRLHLFYFLEHLFLTKPESAFRDQLLQVRPSLARISFEPRKIARMPLRGWAGTRLFLILLHIILNVGLHYFYFLDQLFLVVHSESAFRDQPLQVRPSLVRISVEPWKICWTSLRGIAVCRFFRPEIKLLCVVSWIHLTHFK